MEQRQRSLIISPTDFHVYLLIESLANATVFWEDMCKKLLKLHLSLLKLDPTSHTIVYPNLYHIEAVKFCVNYSVHRASFVQTIIAQFFHNRSIWPICLSKEILIPQQ